MPDIFCFQGGATKTLRQCYFEVTEPGAAKAHKQKWQLKVVSQQVGEGQISARMSNYYGNSVEADYVDPTPENNAAPIRVEVPAESPGSGAELPRTGTRAGVAIVGGLVVLLAGVLLVLAARRHRKA